MDDDRINSNVDHAEFRIERFIFIDDDNRIHRNNSKIFDAKFKRPEFQITGKEQAACLTDAMNLFL